jgi:hypothetical protein
MILMATKLKPCIAYQVNYHPTTDREGPEGQQKYSSTLSLSLMLDGVGCQHHALAALHQEGDLVPPVQEAGWAPGPVWTSVENLAPTGISCPEHIMRLYLITDTYYD